jgi:hypothetical protein
VITPPPRIFDQTFSQKVCGQAFFKKVCIIRLKPALTARQNKSEKIKADFKTCFTEDENLNIVVLTYILII